MIDFKFDFCYENEKIPSLKNAEGHIEKGKCIVLCGSSGCGKSTLLRCINQLIPRFYEGELRGFCRIQGKDTEGLSIGEAGKLAASVFQDPRSQFFTVNSSAEVAFGLENHGVPKDEIIHRVNEAFELFSLERLKDRNVYELSSGERQMVSILSAWAMGTDILLLDEPTANLDFAAVSQLRELLLKLKEQGKTLVLSEHRLYYLSGIADEYWLMSDGEVRKRCTENELRIIIAENEKIPLRTLDLNSVVLSAEPISAPDPFVFSVSNLKFGYRGKKKKILNGVSFQARGGEAVGIIGSNGSGKTTLGKLLTGLLEPSGGEIVLSGKKMKKRALLKNALFVMQESEFQFFTNSVMNELKYGHDDTPEFRKEAERLLKKFGMWECRSRHPFSLSGGQMQKLSLMTAYFSSKKVVVLDEPTAGLDAGSLKSCVGLIREMQREKLVFIITHDIELIAQACTRCICMSYGKTDGEIAMTNDLQLEKLVSFMENNFRADNCVQHANIEEKKCRIHPIIKLLFWLAVMTAASMSNNTLMFSVYAALVLMIFADGRYGAALAGGGLMALFFILSGKFPNTALSFAFVFFQRLLAVWLSVYAFIGKDEASRTISALRSVHIPEKIIMIFSVIFRFFPVLSGDMKLMKQSVQTRGVYSTFGQKLRSLAGYAEILTVPMALRVIRIAETLSASAETRGIALDIKRSSYVSLRYSFWDLIFFIILIAALVIGFIK